MEVVKCEKCGVANSAKLLRCWNCGAVMRAGEAASDIASAGQPSSPAWTRKRTAALVFAGIFLLLVVAATFYKLGGSGNSSTSGPVQTAATPPASHAAESPTPAKPVAEPVRMKSRKPTRAQPEEPSSPPTIVVMPAPVAAPPVANPAPSAQPTYRQPSSPVPQLAPPAAANPAPSAQPTYRQQPSPPVSPPPAPTRPQPPVASEPNTDHDAQATKKKAPPEEPGVEALTKALYAAAGPEIERMRRASLAIVGIRYDDYFGTYSRNGVAEIALVSHNIVKTDSLTSPYLGYVRVSETMPHTQSFPSRVQAARAPFTSTFAWDWELSFAWQSGAWVFKGSRLKR